MKREGGKKRKKSEIEVKKMEKIQVTNHTATNSPTNNSLTFVPIPEILYVM